MNNEFPIYNINYAKEKINTTKSTSIDYKLIKQLASFGLSIKQIAAVCKKTVREFDSLIENDDKLADALREGTADLHISILAGQLRMALPDPENNYLGNSTMLKHLGKVHLGQRDDIDMNIKEDINIELKWPGKINVDENNNKDYNKSEDG